MSRPDYYRQYALECFRLANDSTEPSTKAVLIDMAQAWVKLAEEYARIRSERGAANTKYLRLVVDTGRGQLTAYLNGRVLKRWPYKLLNE